MKLLYGMSKLNYSLFLKHDSHLYDRTPNNVLIIIPSPSYIPPVLNYLSSLPYSSSTSQVDDIDLIMIILEVCRICPDHYKICAIEGQLWVQSVVQDSQWSGELVVLQFDGENAQEVVAECRGWDESGHMVVQFLVVEKSQVFRPKRLVRGFRGGLRH